MCGIVGGVAQRNLTPILLEGLRRLEYRGYDSSGIALLKTQADSQPQIIRMRALGKISALAEKINSQKDFSGRVGIAHTRWATHGIPAENNAHPHICNQKVAVVHNGIIENYQQLKQQQLEKGYRFTSETDTEVVAHAIYDALQAQKETTNLLKAVQTAVQSFEGAYALGVISPKDPNCLVAARKGSPLVIGIGIEEYFIASDVSALLPVTQQFIFLEEGDIACLQTKQLQIYNELGQKVERPIKTSNLSATSIELGTHRHYMHKEIYEQPQAVMDTLEGKITQTAVIETAFGHQAVELFQTIEQVQIVACGTSYHAGLVAKYWLEEIIQMPCQVEVASEYRYRCPVVLDNTLFVTLSQSGETADTLATLQQLKEKKQNLNLPTLTICNVPESSLTRESDLTFLTHAGPEIGVASTKAFTTQLVALALLMVTLGKIKGTLSQEREARIIQGLQRLPVLIQDALEHEDMIEQLAPKFSDKQSALFLGRGTMYPIAMEGALKLKEISYIHAEAYPAGELKHGPLALVDEKMPVIAIAPHDELLEKLKSNLQEVKARGGELIVFEDERSQVQQQAGMQVIKAATNVGRITAPIVFNIPLQLLSYHVALIKGTDVDQPRNLAKSVTVE